MSFGRAIARPLRGSQCDGPPALSKLNLTISLISRFLEGGWAESELESVPGLCNLSPGLFWAHRRKEQADLSVKASQPDCVGSKPPGKMLGQVFGYSPRATRVGAGNAQRSGEFKRTWCAPCSPRATSWGLWQTRGGGCVVRRGWAGRTLASAPSSPARTRVAACAPGTPAERPLVRGMHPGEGHGPRLRSPGVYSSLSPPGQTSLGLEVLVWRRRALPGSRRPPNILSIVGRTCAARPGALH